MNKHDLPVKICLIIPPSGFLLDQRVFATLGPLKVAAVLEENGIAVDVLDLSGYKNYLDIVGDYVQAHPEIFHFGLTTTTPQLPAAMEITVKIRSLRDSQTKIILGGPHVTLTNAAFKKENLVRRKGRAQQAMNRLTETFDTIVAGDGEIAVFHALAKDAPKVVDADITASPLFMTNADLNASPWPARHLIDMNSYHYSIDGVPAASLIAQLGCPFACGFCGGRESATFRRIRTRTSDDIVAEMVFLHETYGFNAFMMYDDELNVNQEMISLMKHIEEAQKQRGVEWRLRGFIKSQLFTDNQAKAMYKAGFRWILVGFESGSEEILTAMNKKASRAENTRCMEIAKRNGLKVKALMSVGHPGESHNTIAETRSWLLEVKPDDFDVSVITCYPGTPYYDHAEPHGRLLDVWTYTYRPTGARLHQLPIDFSVTADYYKGDPNGGYKAFVDTDHLTSNEIVAARNQLEADVRRELGIPFNQSAAALSYEHSMGQGLPANILRSSEKKAGT